MSTRARLAALGPARAFLSRELSWLGFARRVLHLVGRADLPLLERVKFAGIIGMLHDEFFMKRMSGLKREIDNRAKKLSIDGRTTADELAACRVQLLAQVAELGRLWHEELVPGPGPGGAADPAARRPETGRARGPARLLRAQHPADTDPRSPSIREHPFPFISNLGLNLAAFIPHDGDTRFVRIKVPGNRPRWIPLDDRPGVVPIEQVIAANLDLLYPGSPPAAVHVFRVTRAAEGDVDQADVGSDAPLAEPGSIVQQVSSELKARRFAGGGPAAGGQHHAGASGVLAEPPARDRPRRRLSDAGAPRRERPPELRRAGPRRPAPCSARAGRPPPAPPAARQPLGDLRRDRARRHPAAPPLPELRRLRAAVPQLRRDGSRGARDKADDLPHQPRLAVAAGRSWKPRGRASRWRCSSRSRRGSTKPRTSPGATCWRRKACTCPTGWSGSRPTSSSPSSCATEREGVRRYAHLGTGNYHSGTARIYEDVGLLTCDESICNDVATVFNSLTGVIPYPEDSKLLVAPVSMRRRFIELIRREAEHARAGRPSGIDAKMNQLQDAEIIHELYDASGAGVPIRLNVRGLCCLRPGVEGLSETVRVFGVVGRFLEHSRIFRFVNAGQPEHFIGSADWMKRNLNGRVETVIPVEDPALKRELDEILAAYEQDNCSVWDCGSDGEYVLRTPAAGEPRREVQEEFIRRGRSVAEAGGSGVLGTWASRGRARGGRGAGGRGAGSAIGPRPYRGGR